MMASSSSNDSLGNTSRLVCAFDKFRGTATAQELVAVAEAAAAAAGWECISKPLGDGGEGSIDVVGGPNKLTTVTGPLGDPVEAAWRLDGNVAFIEMASASGLLIAGGQEGNDPLAADTFGTGELIANAIELGARTVYVLLGGSATTDGGLGALKALPPAARLKEIDLVVGCDVRTKFCDAARVFGPQKGASPAQVQLLTGRLERLVQVYEADHGVDVSELEGAGAAGGLAGALAAVGARVESGFEVLAEWVALDVALEGATLVVTGEGYLDDESFNGKVVGGVAAWSRFAGVPVVAIVGDRDADVPIPDNVRVVSLVEQFGVEAAFAETSKLVGDVVSAELKR